MSQRGVNPEWRPPPRGAGAGPGPGQGQGMGSYGIVPNRRPVQQQRDVLLSGNPDFELPAGPGGGFAGRGGGGGGVRGGAGGGLRRGGFPGHGHAI